MGRRDLVLLGLILLFISIYYLRPFSGFSASGSVTPSTIEVGNQGKLTVSSISTGYSTLVFSWDWTEDDQTGWCGTDNYYGGYYCDRPFTYQFSDCGSGTYDTFEVFAADGDGGISFDPNYDDFAIDEWCNSLHHGKVLVYGGSQGDRSYSTLKPFNYSGRNASNYPKYTVTIKADLRWYDKNTSSSYMFVAFCWTNGDIGSVDAWSDYGSVYDYGNTFSWTGPDGQSYTCIEATLEPPSSQTWASLYFKIQNVDSQTEFYILQGDTCWLNCATSLSGYPCNDSSGYDKKMRLDYVKIDAAFVEFYPYPSDTTYIYSPSPAYTYCEADYDSGSVSSCGATEFTFTVDSHAPSGTYYWNGKLYHHGICYLLNNGAAQSTSDSGKINGSDFQVVNYADTVTIDSVSASNSDDEVGDASLTVSGGSDFNYVEVSSSCGGSKTIDKSDFSCSGDTCTWSGYLGLDTSTSGEVSSGSSSCTVTATLYAGGQQRDTDQKTVTVYFPSVQNLDVPDTSSTTVSYSFDACGAFDHYDVYLDSTSNKVASKTLSPPSSPGQCRSVSDSVTISDLTKGSHTLYIRLYTSDSGEYDTQSDTFYANITYTGSVTVTAPQDGSTVNQQVSSPGTPSQSITTSANYSTDAPSATLKVYVNSSEKQSWTVSGSGSQSYTAQPSDLVCGTDTFAWKLYSDTDLLASDSSTITLRCWYDKVGPSGTVKIPSSNGQPLDSAYVDVYIDADVNPSTSYTPKLYWNNTDVSSKLTTENCSHTYCARIYGSDVGGFSCGQNVTLKADLLEGNTVRAESTSTITLQCVEQYIIIRRPSDGTAYDLNGQEVPDSFELNVAVDYAGGDTIVFKINDSNATATQQSTCDYDACYLVKGNFQEGNNVLGALLYSNGSLVSEDNITFTIYLWSFITSEQYGTDTGLIVTKEYASHAQRCEVYLPADSNTASPMVYSDTDRTWNYQFTKDNDGENYRVVCYSPTGKAVYSYNGVINFSKPSSGGGGGIGGGGGGISSQPSPPVALPFWPATDRYEYGEWSILDKKPFDAGVFTTASVSSSFVCVGSTTIPSVRVCNGDVPSIPSTEASLSSLVSNLETVCYVVTPTKVGKLYCVKYTGAGLYEFTSSGMTTRILVSKRSIVLSSVLFYVVIGVSILVILYFVLRGGIFAS